jgi:uncharacterized membrane protein YfcA
MRLSLTKLLVIASLLAQCYRSTSFLSKCGTNADCEEAYNSNYICENSKCVHEPFFPLSPWKLAGMVAIVAVSAIANLGGIGGGEIIVPIYIYFFAFTIGDAIPLSKVTILSGSIVTIWYTYNKRREDRPNELLIDFHLLGFIVPMMLAGTVIGVALTKFFPSSLILISMISYILVLTARMFAKAKSLYAKETRSMSAEAERSTKGGSFMRIFRSKLLSNLFRTTNMEMINYYEDPEKAQEPRVLVIEEVSDSDEYEPMETETIEFIRLIRKHLKPMFACFIAFIVVVSTSLLRGGKGIPSVIGLDSCSFLSWVIFIVGQLVCFAMVAHLYLGSIKRQTNVENSEQPTNHIPKKMFKSIIMQAYIAGTLAGTLGMGGGIVINPMLLEMGLEPVVSTAVSSVVVFFTSLSTTTQFFIIGGIDISKVVFILSCSGVGAYISSRYLDKFIQSYRRPSLIVWILFFMLICSTITMTFVGADRVSEEQAKFSFGSPC